MAASNTDAALGAAIVLVSLVSVIIGYPVLFETLSRGRSPGKAAMGLRVVRDDGGPVRFRHALTRALVGVLVDFNPLLVGAVGVVVSLSSAKGKRVGDMLAGTVVIRERVPTSTAVAGRRCRRTWPAGPRRCRCPACRTPWPWRPARWSAGWRNSSPRSAQSLSRQLAEEVLAALGTTAPGGTDPVSILSAVLAERRTRDLARAGIAPQQGPAGWGQPQPAWGAPQPTWGAPQQPAQPVQAPPPPPPAPEPPPPGPFASPG